MRQSTPPLMSTPAAKFRSGRRRPSTVRLAPSTRITGPATSSRKFETALSTRLTGPAAQDVNAYA